MSRQITDKKIFTDNVLAALKKATNLDTSDCSTCVVSDDKFIAWSKQHNWMVRVEIIKLKERI